MELKEQNHMDHVRGNLESLDAGLNHIKRLTIHLRCHPGGLSQDELLVYERKEYIDYFKSVYFQDGLSSSSIHKNRWKRLPGLYTTGCSRQQLAL